jgi:O-antigen/teichoic acid export membrane protein
MAHLDTLRLLRHGHFAPFVSRHTLPAIAALLAIWPASLWFDDYRIALVTIYTQQLLVLIASHVGAKWPYRLGFNRDYFQRAFAFGWPLLANSLLMYLILNGDRIIVGNQLGVEMLGWFSAAVMLTYLPISLIARSFQILFLPQMAKHQESDARLQRQYDLAMSSYAILAVSFVAGTTLVGGQVLVLLFGQKFAPATPYLVLLAMMQGIRLLRSASALAAMARAETKNPLYTNMVRSAFILISFSTALLTKDIFLMILVGIAGEIVATLAAALIAQSSVRLSSRHACFVLGATVAACAAIVGTELMGWTPWLLVPATAILLYSSRDLLDKFRELLRK